MNKKDEQKSLRAITLSASLAGMLARLIVYPIDTIKAKIQVQRSLMKNIVDVKTGKISQLIIQTFKQQGIKGFYKGGTITIFGSTIAFSLYMSFYEHSKPFDQNPTLAHLISGFMAELGSCILWLPIDIIKERMQVQSQVKIYTYKSPLQAMKKIHFAEGLIGLYRAFGATLLFFGPFSAIFFASYQFMKKNIVKDKQKPTFMESMACSATAGSLAGFITNPLELVKLGMQIQRADVGIKGGTLQQSIFGYRNSFHGLYLIIKNEGFFALYRGAMLRVCFSAPMTTLSMTFTEYFKQKILYNTEILN